ncbi:MAG TPA: PqqD family protein [Candidatus Marinimicrobia bacterium]|nr:PqqD family protein [Candidatus Neomarinimicrobiota bacterium]HRS52625.1 PqqD family protein [Candidatus Neomarinimicrobiota bacterium]HRU92087.1 PqqD family protein [Candidatus Neomarinimicrobiota bacterium]
MNNKKGEVMNLYEIVPRPLVESESQTDGKIVLLKPKFRNPFLIKLLQRNRRDNFYRLKLDELGSACWAKFDGYKSAGTICEELESQFGEQIQPVAERVGKFLIMLKKAKLIEY